MPLLFGNQSLLGQLSGPTQSSGFQWMHGIISRIGRCWNCWMLPRQRTEISKPVQCLWIRHRYQWICKALFMGHGQQEITIWNCIMGSRPYLIWGHKPLCHPRPISMWQGASCLNRPGLTRTRCFGSIAWSSQCCHKPRQRLQWNPLPVRRT